METHTAKLKEEPTTMNIEWKNNLFRAAVNSAAGISILASLPMMLKAFRHWDMGRNDFVSDPKQGLFGICVLVSGLFAAKYSSLVADALYPIPRPTTIREAAAAQLAKAAAQQANAQGSRILVPGDRDFHT